MSHVYTERTLKLLFGTASCCAYPGCSQPVIHSDRGLLTPVAEIAHIRSERPHGPRHDPNYDLSKIDAFENLLLLCGPHHHVVDYHHAAYPTSELLRWKDAQIAVGTPAVTDPVGMAQVIQHFQRMLQRATADDMRTLIAGRAKFHLTQSDPALLVDHIETEGLRSPLTSLRQTL